MVGDKRQGNRQKGFHLSADACEMLSQCSMVLGKSESFHVDQAVRDYFMRHYLEHTQAYGREWWARKLEQYGRADRLRIQIKRNDSNA